MNRTPARFRADPEKVRVSIRKDGTGWTATVMCRRTKMYRRAYRATADGAVMEALRTASESGLEGVDLEMEWAYDHPWR